MDADEVV